jgi:hypothetical protein
VPSQTHSLDNGTSILKRGILAMCKSIRRITDQFLHRNNFPSLSEPPSLKDRLFAHHLSLTSTNFTNQFEIPIPTIPKLQLALSVRGHTMGISGNCFPLSLRPPISPLRYPFLTSPFPFSFIPHIYHSLPCILSFVQSIRYLSYICSSPRYIYVIYADPIPSFMLCPFPSLLSITSSFIIDS